VGSGSSTSVQGEVNKDFLNGSRFNGISELVAMDDSILLPI